jgi:signal transduction histidine kinase
LFTEAATNSDSLSAHIQRQVDRVRAGSDINVIVNVLDDDCRIDGPSREAIARAIGEAVANAIEHAQPSQVVVFAETVGAKQVFATVRDDGVGFDLAKATAGHGITHSIVARMEAIGGRADITSSLGAGTEVRLWTQDPSA